MVWSSSLWSREQKQATNQKNSPNKVWQGFRYSAYTSDLYENLLTLKASLNEILSTPNELLFTEDFWFTFCKATILEWSEQEISILVTDYIFIIIDDRGGFLTCFSTLLLLYKYPHILHNMYHVWLKLCCSLTGFFNATMFH